MTRRFTSRKWVRVGRFAVLASSFAATLPTDHIEAMGRAFEYMERTVEEYLVAGFERFALGLPL